ncbi:MAG: D-alanyl-D-alanine carboxypeptidase/D-alanyl-D-alanine-endopeptidase [Proteobacteria bacterium]|nr:MAG: D-alanyl-D-alanine carboxypeptidase/D-alanyl-D-alanine-endopeptidase [Pseudomonadota bacterium]
MKSWIRRAAPPSNLLHRLFAICALIPLAYLPSMTLRAQNHETQTERFRDDLNDGLRQVLNSKQFSACVTDLATGKEIFSVRPHAALKPASVLKIPTSIAAFEKLGVNYRFKTEVRSERGSGGEVIYIKGGGDPSLTTEQLWAIARKLKMTVVKDVKRMILDSSSFSDVRGAEGHRAYQTGSSALSFNHNSMAVTVCSAAPGKAAYVNVDPWESGIQVRGTVTTSAKGSTDIQVAGAQGGSFRVQGKIRAGSGCETFYRSVSNPEDVLGHVLAKFLQYLGIAGPQIKVTKGVAPSNSELLFSHDSPALSRILQDLNQFSTNFIAEQIVFALGRDDSSGTYSRDKGLRTMSELLLSKGVKGDDFAFYDGSGLSHDNRITCSALTRLLSYAYHSPFFGPEFKSSLSIVSQTGTLKKRGMGEPAGVIRAKTGTLNSVSTLAGYVASADGKEYAFALLNNAAGSPEAARKIEDDFVERLSKW